MNNNWPAKTIAETTPGSEASEAWKLMSENIGTPGDPMPEIVWPVIIGIDMGRKERHAVALRNMGELATAFCAHLRAIRAIEFPQATSIDRDMEADERDQAFMEYVMTLVAPSIDDFCIKSNKWPVVSDTSTSHKTRSKSPAVRRRERGW